MTTLTDTSAPIQPIAGTVDISSLVKAGTAALEDGDLRTALEHFEEVVAAYPDRPEGHNNLGALYSSLGEFAKAEECFDRVLDLLPKNPNILYNRGVVRSRLEKFDSARIDFEAVLTITPEDADTYNNLGVADFMQGRLKQARKNFKKALRLRPEYPNAVLNLCDVAIALKETPTAVRLCEEYLDRFQSIDVRRKQLDLLSGNCRQALEKASHAAESLLMADEQNADVRQELGRLIQAKSVLEKPTAT